MQTINAGGGPTAIAVGGGVVWVANALDSTLSRIDERTGDLLATTRLAAPPSALALGAGAVWVASASANRVLRLHPATARVVQTIPVGTGPTAIAVEAGAVWVANGLDGTVSRVDARRNVVTDTVGVGARPAHLTIDEGSLWVANAHADSLTEVDLETRRAVPPLRVDGRPQGLAVTGGAVFAGIGAVGTAHRGGTLQLLKQEPDFDSLDPARLASVSPAQLLGLTNDGLVTLNHAEGSAGLQVVPNLAVALPAPADGGTSYTFQVRRGIRYSTGRPLLARDFRYSMERVFRLRSHYAPVFAALVGASACRRRPATCDLSRGIRTDDRQGTVTFRLREPDPDFLQKLALACTAAVPDGSARDEARSRPLPATGPYMIERYEPGHELRLVRNPEFREWSAAAQPAGFPDTIVWRLGIPLGAAFSAIEAGRADWVLQHLPLSARRYDELEARSASELRTNQMPGLDYFILNTRVPPFDDVRVRRALNFAVDRAAFARRAGAQPACAVVPPQLPGFSRYCPYRHDMARARRLVEASGTAGARVTVVSDIRTLAASYVVRVLRRLGYAASLRLVPGRRYGPAISDSRERTQIASGGWWATYPAASHFYEVKLSCAAYRPASPRNNNEPGFCDRSIEAEAERARRLGLTDPAAAERRWERVYRHVLDRAPWLTLTTARLADLVSERVGNYQFHPTYGLLADQLWAR